MSIQIELLIPTQSGVRDRRQIEKMVDHVQKGKIFDKAEIRKYGTLWGLQHSPLINIRRFPDENFYIHDGHHRILAIHLAGRTRLETSEYRITEWTFDQYTNIELDKGWFTPFDPRIEIRNADFNPYKRQIREALSACRNEDDRDLLTRIIRNSKQDYASPRGDISHIEQLAFCFTNT